VENFSNDFETTLQGSITAGATSMVVTTATGAPAAPFRGKLDDEIIRVTAIAGTTLTIERGLEGTAAAAHADGAIFQHVLTAAALDAFESHAGYATAAPWSALDIWDEVNWTTLGTYAAYIASIDAALAGEIASGDVVKTDRGACSDGSTRVYSYRAGEGTARWVLVAGQHGTEQLGMAAARRWFEAFAQSTDPVMRALRDALQVEFVPAANPAGYRSSRTAPGGGGTDPNRNYPFFWAEGAASAAAYPSSGSQYKGASALSLAETTIIKAIVDEGRTLGVIDCHDQVVTDPDELIYAGPSSWALGNRELVYQAAEAWHAVYGSGLTSRELLTPGTVLPSLVDWASWYLRWSLGRRNAASVLVEAPGDAGASTTTLTTRTGIQRYAGFITLFLQRWFASGQRAPAAVKTHWFGRRITDSPALTATDQAVVWDGGISPNNGPTTTLDYIDAVPHAPGAFYIRFKGYAASATSGDRVDVRIEVNGAVIDNTVDSVTINSVDGRVHFESIHREPVTALDGATVYRFRAVARRGAGTGGPVIRRGQLEVEFVPNTPDQATPLSTP
jgi:hypothetical protein